MDWSRAPTRFPGHCWLDLNKFHSLSTPRSYLVGTEDTVPPGDEGWHAGLAQRLGEHRLVQMPGGHELLFTNPIGLADKRIEARPG